MLPLSLTTYGRWKSWPLGPEGGRDQLQLRTSSSIRKSGPSTSPGQQTRTGPDGVGLGELALE